MIIKEGTLCYVSGDSNILGLTDYNVRVSTPAIVIRDCLPKEKNILLSLDEIDGDHNVLAFIPKKYVNFR